MSTAPEGVDRPTVNVVARRVLLDSLQALSGQADAVTVVGAQAVYPWASTQLGSATGHSSSRP